VTEKSRPDGILKNQLAQAGVLVYNAALGFAMKLYGISGDEH
jgi:hypothetical protein